jgi:hypothetical protein
VTHVPTLSPSLASRLVTRSYGEVEGPADHVSQARRAHNFDWVPLRPTTSASRTPPKIVRRSHLRCSLLRGEARRLQRRLEWTAGPLGRLHRVDETSSFLVCARNTV